MYTLNYLDQETVNREFATRLRWAEQERLALRVLANKPKAYAPLLTKLGDLLVAFGTNLKRHLPPELVKA